MRSSGGAGAQRAAELALSGLRRASRVLGLEHDVGALEEDVAVDGREALSLCVI